jgi:4-hydroxybenzoate polyprenyltransferase
VVLDADRFVRIHFLFFSCLWPLLGAVSVGRDGSVARLTMLLLVAVSFHVYAFVLNDVIDLPIDRTQPRRLRDPLVRGAIRPSQALALALIQPALAIALTVWLGGGLRELAILAVAFGAMGAYNLWGKRCPAPPATDFVQGLAWGCLPIYAAYVLGAAPNRLTWMVSGYAVGYTLFMNGVHGGLRDLRNDLGQGAQTTAIFLGARPAADGGDPDVPRAVAVFTSAALACLVAIDAALLFINDFGYGPATLAVTSVVVAVFSLLSVILMPQVVRPAGPGWEMAFRLQMYLVLMSLPVAFLGAASAATIVALAVLKAVSMAVLDSTAEIVHWVETALRSVVRRAAGQTIDSRASR